MSFKKNLKKSLVLGALMSFVITGNVYADSVKVVEKEGGLFGKTYEFLYTDNSGNETTYNLTQVLSDSEVREKVLGVIGENLNDYVNSEELQTQIGGLKNQIADLSSQLGVSQEQLDEALADAAAKAEEITDLTDQLTKSQDDLQKALADAEAKAEEIAQLKADLDAGVITQEEYAEKLAAATAEAEAKAKEIADLTANNETIQGLLGDAQAELETLRNQVANAEALKEKIAGLETQLKQYEELKEVLGGGDLSQTLNNLNQVKDDLHKVASLAGTVEETIEQAKAKAAEYEALAKENTKWVQDKIGNFETKLEANIEYTQNALKNKIDTVEGKLSQYEAAIAGKIDKVEDKLNSYEEAIKDNIQYTDGKVGELADAVKDNINKVQGEIKEQAGILKDVQENVIKDITYDKETDTTKVDNNVNITKDLTVGGNANIAGTLTAGDLAVTNSATIGKDLTVGNDFSVTNNATIGNALNVGNSIIVNEGEANQVKIDANGIQVGTGSVYITGSEVSIGKIGEAGSIQLSTLGDVDKLAGALAGSATVVDALNKEAELRKEADAKLQAGIDQNKADIATNKADIATNKADIATNKEAIAKETENRIAGDEANRAAIAQNQDAISGLNQRLGKLNGKVNKVGAGAAALAALHPLEYDPDDKLTFSAGMGNYAGQNAAALGAFYRPNEKLMFSLGGTMGNGENMVNLGVSIGLDGATGLAKMSKRELIQKVNSMEAEMAELRALVIKLAAEKK